MAENNNAGHLTRIAALRLSISCPISHRIMTDPVILSRSGYSYERQNIVEWLAVHGTDPMTGELLDDDGKRLIPNPMMVPMIQHVLNVIRVLRARERLANERAGLPAEGPVEDA
jgi:hypothetical protein